MEETARRRTLLVVAVVAGGLLLVTAAAVVALQLMQRTQPGVLSNVVVEGEHVGGQSHEELVATVRRLAADADEEAVEVISTREAVTATRAEVGATVAVDETVDEVRSVGRRGVIRALRDHVAARRGQPIEKELERQVDERAVRTWAAQAAEELTEPPRTAGISFDASAEPPGDDDESRAVVTEPVPGQEVDAGALTETLLDALEDPGPLQVDAPGPVVEPDVVDEDLEAVLRDARRAVSAPVILTHPAGGPDVELQPADIAAALGMELDEDAPEGERFSIVADPEALEAQIDEDVREELDVDPVEADFEVAGGEVSVVGGQAGFTFEAEETAAALVAVATGPGEREGELDGEHPEPTFTREDAEDLQITEEVSSFTTEHAPAEPRVHNIQLMADIVDGAIIEPGERFELNEHVGPRTAARGFVEGGVIVEGEFEEQVGGGVSQFATTFFNAAFFAGIEIEEFQPHSYYISRYPEGHEATIVYGAVDLAVSNDSPYGILVKTSYTETSITVTFYSTPWAEVEVDAGPRENVVPGERRDGFDITFTRTITYPDGEQEVEEYFHRYEPENEA